MDHKTKTDTGVNFTGRPRDQRPKITGNKYFVRSPGRTFKLKEDIIRSTLEQISGLRVFTVEECDVILLLCFIVSRTGTDIDAALNELKALSESKPTVFMVLHHTFDPEKIVPDSSSYVSREKTLTVDCLFHEDEGFLKCVKNGDALTRIRQWLQPQDTQDKEEITTFNGSDLIIASELMLVLLGMSVHEKTAVEHMIFGKQESQGDTPPAPLMKITVDTGEVDGGQVAVINTPDWFSSGLSPEQIIQKIQLCVHLSSRGPYALLLVITVKQFIEKEREITEIFQNRFCERLMILFTATNEQEKQEIQKYHLKQLKDKHAKSFHVLNISQIGDRSQVSELLKTVEKIVAGNADYDFHKMNETQIEEAIRNRKSKQVSVGEERNYVKVPLQNLQRTVWIAQEPHEPFEIIDVAEELKLYGMSRVV